METVIIGFALVGIVAAVIAFLRTSPESRYRISPEPEEGDAEYAEQYTRRERARFVLLALGFVLPLMAALELWGFPALREFAETSYCYKWFGINGTVLLIYGLFAGLPLGSALVVGMPVAYYGIRVIRERRYPPRGAKVMKRTRIRHGWRAINIGYAHQLPLVFFLCLATWGWVKAGEFLEGFDPAKNDVTVCAPEQEREVDG